MNSAAEFTVPNWRMRAKVVGSLLLFVAWGISHRYWFGPLSESLRCVDPCQRLVELRIVVVYLCLLPLPLAVWLSTTAQQIYASGQVPPPGSWQLYRTRVYRGWRATAAALTYAVLGIFAAASIGVIAHTLGLTYVFCIAESCGCA